MRTLFCRAESQFGMQIRAIILESYNLRRMGIESPLGGILKMEINSLEKSEFEKI
ncbi:MAG: hypothetical protein ACD_79C01080G0001 [uncultured bacterium]|nr:MAG: hypothetical protein ACD_79C01080G0001 [uncultured bacterium]